MFGLISSASQLLDLTGLPNAQGTLPVLRTRMCYAAGRGLGQRRRLDRSLFRLFNGDDIRPEAVVRAR